MEHKYGIHIDAALELFVTHTHSYYLYHCHASPADQHRVLKFTLMKGKNASIRIIFIYFFLLVIKVSKFTVYMLNLKDTEILQIVEVHTYHMISIMNAGDLLISKDSDLVPARINIQWFSFRNIFKNIVCKMCAMLFKPQWFNSLAPRGFDYSVKLVNFKLISTMNISSIFCEIAIRWMPQHLTDWSSVKASDIHIRAISQEMPQPSITKIRLKITVNSFWPSDTIWLRSGSTLAQVMACCLTAPSHYLNQCWLIISEVQWHSYKSNFTRDASTITNIRLKITYLKFQSNSPGANELIHSHENNNESNDWRVWSTNKHLYFSGCELFTTSGVHTATGELLAMDHPTGSSPKLQQA